ncbi:MAG TPA: glycosyltransferase family 39 protein [Thermoanaerobaculaceae bacterium]|nr:glycosyltransferase family 39 protein [Thermoanaerobaculaceae bacterium]HRS16525.1 glycosyltransferase family 39 protein [Thermoanaerobaculaceae bacterium]
MAAGTRTGWTRALEIAARVAGPAALLGWCALEWRWRPRDPLEPDEYAFLGALAPLDAAPAAPRPPVGPVYLLAGRLFGLALGDGERGLQALAVLAGGLCLALLWALARRHSGRPGVAWASALGLAALPGFMFHAGVGLPDVPALACLLGAWALGLTALERPRWLWAAAVAVALAAGVRPAVVPALVPLAAAVLIAAGRARRWRDLGVAAACGLGASLVIWGPALAAAGSGGGLEAPGQGVGRVGLGELARHWLQHPFGDRLVAGLVWLAAGVGALGWWRAGHRRLVLLVGGGGVLYLAGAVLLLDPHSAVRFGLPLLPVLALGAAGSLLWDAGPARRVATAALCGLAASMVWETAPVMQTRRRPAPVSAAVEFATRSGAPERTHLVFGRDLAAHAAWWLPRLGLAGEVWREDRFYLRTTGDGREVAVVTTEPVPGLTTVFERSWSSNRFREMTGGRYATAVVQVPPAGVGSLDVPGLEIGEQNWRVRRGARVALSPGGSPQVFEVCPLSSPVGLSEPGREPRQVWPGECADVLLLPGPAGEIGIESGEDGALVQPLVFTPVAGRRDTGAREDGARVRRFPRGPAWVVPVVARLDGARGARWVSTLEVVNRSGVAGGVVVARLPSKKHGSVLPALEAALMTDDALRLEDVLARPELAAEMPVGALLVGLDVFNPETELGLEVRARTFNLRGSGGADDGFLPAVPLERGVVPGESAGLGELAVTAGDRVAAGAVAVGSSAVRMTFVAVRSDDEGERRRELSAPVLGHSQEPWDLPPGRWRLAVTLARGDSGVRVVPYVSHVGRDGRAAYLVASSTLTREFGAAILVAARPLASPEASPLP